MNFRMLFTIFSMMIVSQAMFCNYYPMNSKACVQQTLGIACQYYSNENTCQSTASTSLGCVNNLNQVACQQQTSGIGQIEVHCYFGTRCKPASKTLLRNVGCSPLLSRYSCTNVIGKLCIWNNGCQVYTSSTISGSTCGTVYNAPVVGALCSLIPQLNCMNNGLASDYKCIDVPTASLSTLLCTQLGLSLPACMAITTPGQQCIFIKGLCQNYVPVSSDLCSQNYNRIACLSVTNPQAYCNWDTTKGQCVTMTLTQITNGKCALLTNVNASVCSQVGTICKYDSVNFGCSIPKVSEITCNTPGLNQSTCITLNSPCQYLNQVCSSLTAYQLNILPCSASLNAAACVAITTKYQKCQWNATLLQCQNIELLKSISCASLTNVNGNVCKAVVSEGCKYNSQIQSCILSSTQDVCSTPYLNLQGCTSIRTYNVQCQWLNETCTSISVLSYDTKCSSLIYANANACAAVFETPSLKIGCYYNTETFSCTPISIPDLTSTLYCNTLGLNALGCASVQVAGQRCRWYQGNCTSLDRPSDIAQIPCLNLAFSNAATCAMVTYGSQMCFWDQQAFSCTAAVDYKSLTCLSAFQKGQTGDIGLNSFACGAITSSTQVLNCFYDTINYTCINYSTGDLKTPTVITQLNTALCSANSPTASLCTAITNPTQLCYWNANISSCQTQYVPMNSACGQFKSVNVNVCASIVAQNPFADYISPAGVVQNNSGFCSYVATVDSTLGFCSLFSFDDISCSTNCCESKIGINAHVCSRFTNQASYCYFTQGLRCANLADILVLTGSVSDNDNTVSSYLNANQFTCAQLNIKTCWMLTWSTTQKCFQSFSKGACVQVDYAVVKALADKIKVPQHYYLTILSNVVVNQYTCQGIQGYQPSCYSKPGCQNNQYFKYDSVNHKCQDYLTASSTPITSCTSMNSDLVNQNVCTGKTTWQDSSNKIKDTNGNILYCIWSPLTLSCGDITIQPPSTTILQQIATQIAGCDTNAVNENVCLSIQGACSYSSISDSCITITTFDLTCDHFTSVGSKVTAQVCQMITGQRAQCYYKADTQQCIDYTSMSGGTKPNITGCDVFKGNAITCYQSSLGNCKWNSTTMTCIDIAQGDLQTLSCGSGVNKQVCLQLTSQPCKWDDTIYQCVYFTASLAPSVDIVSAFNSQACQSVTFGPCYFKQLTSTCDIFADNTNTCTFAPMNQLGCTIKTRGQYCQYLNGNCVPLTTLPTTCTGTPLINVDACMRVPQPCQFSQTTGLCTPAIVASTTSCLSMTAGAPLFNIAACTAVTSTTINDNNNGCGGNCSYYQCGFEKYCQWYSTSYTCLNQQLMPTIACNDYPSSDGNGHSSSNYQCDRTFINPLTTCSAYYSQAQCFQLTNTGCIFTSANGCASINGNAFTVPACSNANGSACIQITNPSIQCQAVATTDSTAFKPSTVNCDFSFPQSTICQQYIGLASDCNTLAALTGLSPSTCIQAIDACAYDWTNHVCYKPASAGQCSDTTQSATQCALNAYCIFTTYCQYKDQVTASNSCTITMQDGDDRLQQFCIAATSSCLYTPAKKGTSGNPDTPAQCAPLGSCNSGDITSQIVSKLACTSCADHSSDAYQYDPLAGSCTKINSNVNTCSNLNQQACLQYSTPYCQWNGSACIVLDNANFASYAGMCESLNVSSCKQVGIPCIIKSNLCTTGTIENGCSNVGNKGNAADCMQVTAACKWDSIGGTCINAAAYSYCNSFGIGSCSNNNGQCYWDPSANNCIQTTLNNCTVQLNKAGCLISTSYTLQAGPIVKNACVYTSNKCTQFNLSSTPTPDITTLNKHACLSLNQLVYWNDACLVLTISNINAVCAQNGVFSTVPQACATSNSSTATILACQQDYKTDICTAVTSAVTCTQAGLNKVGCLTKTDGVSCQFTNNACSFYTAIVDGCSNTLNQYACLKQPNAPCIFSNGVCSSFTINTAVALNWQPAALTVQNPWICSQYNYNFADANKAYLLYSSATLTCVGYTTQTNIKCTDPGVNQNTCMAHTYQTCQYKNNSCQLLTSLSNLVCTTAGINLVACTTLSTKSCKFVNDACIDTPTSDTCTILAASYASPLACSSTLDIGCYWNANQCKALAASKIDCSSATAVGLNKIACIKSTTNTCLYKITTSSCLYDTNTALNCSDTTYSLNETKCYSIRALTQYCQFTVDGCVPWTPTTTCVTGKLTNPVSCSLATGSICAYNTSTNQCIVPTTAYANCYDLAYNRYNVDMNVDHCVQTTSTSQMCVWVDSISQCRLIADAPGMSLNTLLCTQNVNQNTCTKITTPGQLCYYLNNVTTHKCSPVVSSINCANITKVNSPQACTLATDVKCYYNIATNSCAEQPSKSSFICSTPGLNNKACQGITGCTFDSINHCYDNSTIKLCNQITTQADCQSNNTLQCFWDVTCKDLIPNTYADCEAAADAVLSIAGCQSLFASDGISQCIQNTMDPYVGCIINIPKQCTDIKTQTVCVKFSSGSCIWMASTCISYANVPQTHTCTNLSQVASQRACLSIIRQGSYCTYDASALGVVNQLTCLDILTPPLNCLPLVNYDGCVFSESVNCIWNPITQICSTFVPTQNQVCGGYITQVTCIAPTLATPYCQWNDTTKCSNVTPSNNKVCSQYSSQQTCQAASQVYSICQWDNQASNCTNIACSPLLSYQACLNLTTTGQFCQWSSNYCQSIDQAKLPAIITLDTIQIINANACGLINQGMVQYDSNLRKCVTIYDVSLLTCITPGLNQLACVSIKAQQCIWNSLTKNCQVKQTRLLSTYSCFITGVSQQICRQISGPISCAYLNGNCIQMSPTATCSDEGINQYGCVSITTNPCLWLNGQCVDYEPYTLCSLVPSPVNAVTCSQVDEDACLYSPEQKSCIAPPSNANCSLLGINSIACAQIPGCAYLNSQCRKITENLDCGSLAKASPQVCALAINRCKYVDVFYGCAPSAITDDCFTSGLSQISCASQVHCFWADCSCQCQLYNDTFPVCSQVATYAKCSSLNYCIFIVSQTNSAIDITQQLQAQDFGVCRQRLCSDIAVINPNQDCQGVSIKGTVCYVNQSNKCVAAQQCSDVVNSAIDCYIIIFNGKRCANSLTTAGSCVNLNCLLLNSTQCSQYYDDCYLSGANCIAKPCEQKAISQCLQGQCNWNVDTQSCQTQVPCGSLSSQSMCETNYESGAKCGYIVNQSGKNQCVSNGCRYMGLTQSTCSGTHIGNTVCVTMSDRSCVACEEITSSCLCLQQPQCLYNNVHSYCYSNNCQRFAAQVCPSRCRIISSTNTCEPPCQNQYNPVNCNNAFNCQWSTTQNICLSYIPPATPYKIILPKLFSEILCATLLILMI